MWCSRVCVFFLRFLRFLDFQWSFDSRLSRHIQPRFRPFCYFTLLFFLVTLSPDLLYWPQVPVTQSPLAFSHDTLPLSIELSLTSKKKQNGTARQSDDGAIQHIKRSMIISLLLSRLLVNMVLPLLQSTLSSECLFHFQVGVGICRARCLLSTNMQDEMIVFEYMRERRFFFSGKTQCCHPLFYSLPVLC